MKQLFTLLAFLLVGSAVASAQSQEESYYWQTWIYSNPDARLDAGFPQLLGDDDQNTLNNVQWRGMGQVVNLSLLYNWFDAIYNVGDSVVAYRRVGEDFSDQDYIDQFKGASAFTVDTILTWIYSLDPNAQNNTETLGSFFSIYRSDYDFNSTQYRSQGFHQALADVRGEGDVNVLVEDYLEPAMMAGNINGTQVTQSVFTYPEGQNTFGPGESAILLFWNPLDPAYSFEEIQEREQQNGKPDQRNYIFAQTEFRNGDYGQNEQGQLFDTRTDSLTYYKVLGLVLYRQGSGTDRVGNADTDTLHSSWRNLFVLGRTSLLDMRSLVIGTVELSSGVTYHFGRDAAEQGLGQVTPNPVTADSRLPFALNGKARVTIEIYSTSGRKVTTLLENEAYIGGNYSLPLPVSSLENGTYLVRMTANEDVYSMKFTVTK